MTITHDHDDYINYCRRYAEEQEAYHHCQIKPNKADTEDFLNRFKQLPQADKRNAIITSKQWGNKLLTQRMQQLF